MRNPRIGKAAADVYLPVGGKVVAVNGALPDKPELVNSDPLRRSLDGKN